MIVGDGLLAIEVRVGVVDSMFVKEQKYRLVEAVAFWEAACLWSVSDGHRSIHCLIDSDCQFRCYSFAAAAVIILSSIADADAPAADRSNAVVAATVVVADAADAEL